MTTVSIYGLLDPRTQELRYIGKTHKKLSDRFIGHRNDNAKTHKANWFRAVVQDGFMPEIFLIEESTDAEWQEDERFWISYFRSVGCNLTNMGDGGEGNGGLKHTPEWNKKISQAHIGKKMPPVTDDTRKRLSEAGKGRVFSEDARNRIGESNIRTRQEHPEIAQRVAEKNRGAKRSAESKKKMSLAQLGKKRSPEAVAKVVAFNTGRKNTPETIERMRQAAKTRKKYMPTPEHVENMRRGLIAHYKNFSSKNRGRKLSKAHKKAISDGLRRHYDKDTDPISEVLQA